MYLSRSISRLLASLRKNDDTLTHLLDIDEEVGQDFLFLFDLLSHTSGRYIHDVVNAAFIELAASKIVKMGAIIGDCGIGIHQEHTVGGKSIGHRLVQNFLHQGQIPFFWHPLKKCLSLGYNRYELGQKNILF